MDIEETGPDPRPPEEPTAIIPRDNQLTRQQRYSKLPSTWMPSNVPDEWLDKLEAMILNSALTTGAAVDPTGTVETGLAMQIANHLRLVGMPYEALDAAYTRWLTLEAIKPEWRGQVVTSMALVASWHAIEAIVRAEEAAQHERALDQYRMRETLQLQSKPLPVATVAERAAQDGVDLTLGQVDWRASRPQRTGTRKPKGVPRTNYPVPDPAEDLSSGEHRTLGVLGTPHEFDTGEPESHADGRSKADTYVPTGAELDQPPEVIQRRLQQAENESTWYTMLSEHERNEDRKDRKRKDDGRP